MKTLNRGFVFAALLHINAIVLLFQNKKVLRWYSRTILISLIITGLILVTLFFSGLWVVWDLYQPLWLDSAFEKGLLSILWTLVLVFVSTFLGSQLASLWVQIIPSDKNLMNAVYGDHQKRTLVVPKKICKRSYFVKNEIFAIFLNLILAGFCWPFLFFPILLPIGVCFFAYGLGREAFAVSEKMYFDRSFDTWSEQGHRPGFGFYVALGLPSVVFGLIPLLGFLGLPLVRLTALLAASPEREYLLIKDFKIRKSPDDFRNV